ncbi:MAG: lipoyl(octanoyl) transferase LipB [Chlorobi bacterium]|nr:lipoyl(octanoyl) transferase LipB [Chlorobiota bacterium]
MSNKLTFKDLGTIDYGDALQIQEELFYKKIKNKTSEIENVNDVLICEHPHVYTIGKSGNENNLLINDDFLKKINATYFKTDRGGDITYHGYGQLVVYPIVDLKNFNIGIKDYIYKLEYLIINLLKEFNVKGEISDGNIGVWLDVGKTTERKICAMGVKVSKGITMHGLALNINTDLSYFNHINPCGFTNKGATSIKNELGKEVDFNEVKEKFKYYFKESFI